jgi:hypothetical protein
MRRVSRGVWWLCRGVYGDLQLIRCSRGSGQVMLAMMVDDMIIQETSEIVKWAGGMFGGFGWRRRMLLLGCGMLWRVRLRVRSGGSSKRIHGATARNEANLGSHGRVLHCGRALLRTVSRL